MPQNNQQFNFTQGQYFGTEINSQNVVTTQRDRLNTTTMTTVQESRRFLVGAPLADGRLPLTRIRETFTRDGKQYAVSFVPNEPTTEE